MKEPPGICRGEQHTSTRICPFDGQCGVSATHPVLDEAMTVNLQIGHTDAFRLWLNGELLTGREEPELVWKMCI